MRFNKSAKLFSITSLLMFSLVIHLSIVLLVAIVSSEKKKEFPSLLTRLVTPEEFAGIRPERPQGRSGVLPDRPAASQGKKGTLVPAARTKMGSQVQRLAAPVSPRHGTAAMPQIHSSVQGSDKNAVLPQVPVNGGTSLAATPADAGAPAQTQKGAGNVRNLSSVPSNREKLFDRAIIAGVVAKEELKRDNIVKLDTKDFKYGPYMGRLRDKIESVWKYPAEAVRRGLYGDLEITFTITRNGRLSEVEVTRTSGNSSLDAAAVQALRDGEPYWPLPEDWGKDSITIPGHFTYTLYGTTIR